MSQPRDDNTEETEFSALPEALPRLGALGRGMESGAYNTLAGAPTGVEALCDEIAAVLAGKRITSEPPGLCKQPLPVVGPPAAAGSPRRWWTKSAVGCTCPVSGVPIASLPYPPFRLRINPKCSNPHRLIDGKYLALHVIVTGDFKVCGRALDRSDMEALDDHITRCKLGTFKPGMALLLARAAISPEASMEERAGSHRALGRYVEGARVELERLRHVRHRHMEKPLGRVEQSACFMEPPVAYGPTPTFTYTASPLLLPEASQRQVCLTVSAR